MTVEDQLRYAKSLIQSGRYVEARNLLQSINHPTARRWLATLETRYMYQPEVKPRTGMMHFWRWVWGVAVLLSCGWMTYGVVVTGQLVERVTPPPLPTIQPFPTIGPFPTINSPYLPPVSIDTGAINELSAASAELMESSGELARLLPGLLATRLSLTFFLCTGLPVFLLAVILYWRNGVAIRSERQHAEMLAVRRY